MIQDDDLSVNGIMSSEIFLCTVAVGKTAYDSIDQPKYMLDKLGITSVDRANFKLLVLDKSTFDTIRKSSEAEVIKGPSSGAISTRGLDAG